MNEFGLKGNMIPDRCLVNKPNITRRWDSLNSIDRGFPNESNEFVCAENIAKYDPVILINSKLYVATTEGCHYIALETKLVDESCHVKSTGKLGGFTNTFVADSPVYLQSSGITQSPNLNTTNDFIQYLGTAKSIHCILLNIEKPRFIVTPL